MSDNALAASHEIEKCRAACRRGSRIGIVQEAARGAVEKNRVVLFQLFFSDVRQAIADGSGPKVALITQGFHCLRRQRNGTVNKAARTRVAEDQNLARACRFRARSRGQRCHHGVDIRLCSNHRRRVAPDVESAVCRGDGENHRQTFKQLVARD